MVVRLVLGMLTFAGAVLTAAAQSPVELLRPISGLPPHIVNQFERPLAFARASTDEYLVLDRRQHSVYLIDAATTNAKKVVEIGTESGRVLQPAALALSDDDILAVYDAPNGFDRVQYFSLSGMYINSFVLPVEPTQRMIVGGVVLAGSSALGFTGKTFLVNLPAWGSLFVELDTSGRVLRHIGQLRRTGHESDLDLHRALNSGIPVVDPTGGFFFVFRTGVPMFRKYDAAGRLLYERHVEGVELDADIAAIPTAWPRPPGSKPLVVPLVSTAAADRSGRLWVSLMDPFTYVYDSRGEKRRTVQFRGTYSIVPTSLFFDRRGRVLVTPGGYEFSVNPQ